MLNVELSESEEASRCGVKREVEDIWRTNDFRTFNVRRSTDQQIPGLLHERRFTRRNSGSAIATEAVMSNAG
jgi:hypothetical protein